MGRLVDHRGGAGVAEAFTLTAALGILGGAAPLTAGVAGIGLSATMQFLVFALAASVRSRPDTWPGRGWNGSAWTRSPGAPATSCTR